MSVGFYWYHYEDELIKSETASIKKWSNDLHKISLKINIKLQTYL